MAIWDLHLIFVCWIIDHCLMLTMYIIMHHYYQKTLRFLRSDVFEPVYLGHQIMQLNSSDSAYRHIGCARLKSPGSTLVDLIPVLSNTICLPIMDKKSTWRCRSPIVHNQWADHFYTLVTYILSRARGAGSPSIRQTSKPRRDTVREPNTCIQANKLLK